MIVEPLTLANYRILPMTNDGRPDTDRVAFLVKTPPAGEGDGPAAQPWIERFIRSVPAAGRAEIRSIGTSRCRWSRRTSIAPRSSI